MQKQSTKLRHFRARRHKSGRVWYYYDLGFDADGKRREIPLGDNYVEAVRLWATHEGNKAPPKSAEDAPTFDMAVQRYIQEILPRKAARTQRDNLSEIDMLMSFFGSAPLSDIKPSHIRQYLEWRIERAKKMARERASLSGGKPVGIKADLGSVRANREKALFSHIFNAARSWGMTDATNPCAGIRSHKESGRDHYIDDAVYRALHAHADDWMQHLMDIADLTGQRPGDVRAMRWQDVRDGLLWVAQAKTKAKLRIRITGDLEVALDRAMAYRRNLESMRVVCAQNLVVNHKGQPISQEQMRSAWGRARLGAARAHPDMAEAILASQFRDLRARAGTDADAGAGIGAARDLLGHEEEKMTRHYVRNRAGKIVDPVIRKRTED